jgi:hypothetical protein
LEDLVSSVLKTLNCSALNGPELDGSTGIILELEVEC